MSFSQEQIDALEAPLDRSVVKERSQAGRKFSYIEGWWAIKEANRIFGHDAWDRVSDLRKLGEPEQVNGKWRVRFMCLCTLTVRAGDRTITRQGTGYGSGIAGDMGDAYESAIKEAETDAMKRALMTFGNPFGLALYDKTQADVADAEPEKSASAYSLKKNGEWDNFYERLCQMESPDEAREWYFKKARPHAVKMKWPSSWLDEADEELAKHCQYLMDQKAKVA